MSLDEWTNQVHQGDAREVLAQMPESSVHMAMTSPPYWGLRDYGVDGQLGLEASIDEYLNELLAVFDEVRRVLRPDGSFWVNIGDRYATKKPGNPGDRSTSTLHGGDITDWYSSTLANTEDEARATTGQGVPEKSLLCIPDRLRLALLDRGWIIRGSYPWIKDKPDSAQDRLRKGPEVLIQLSSRRDYWHDPREMKHPGWFDIPAAQFPEAHYATFPEELVELPVRSTSPSTVCADCGAPYERVLTDVPLWERSIDELDRKQQRRALELYESSDLTLDHLKACRATGFMDAGQGAETQNGFNADDVERLAREAKEVLGGYFREFCGPLRRDEGLEKACGCDTDATDPGVVLDPFAGSGTTCRVAKDLGRRFVGIDLNPEYVAMAQRRSGIDVEKPELLLDDGQVALAQLADGGFTSLVEGRDST